MFENILGNTNDGMASRMRGIGGPGLKREITPGDIWRGYSSIRLRTTATLGQSARLLTRLRGGSGSTQVLHSRHERASTSKSQLYIALDHQSHPNPEPELEPQPEPEPKSTRKPTPEPNPPVKGEEGRAWYRTEYGSIIAHGDLCSEAVANDDGEMHDLLTTSTADKLKNTLHTKVQQITNQDHGVDGYWKPWLLRLTKPSAQNLVHTLVSDNKFGFKHGMPKLKKGSLMEYAISEKEKHPSKIILLRVGEFFETYGIDALMLVEFAGLNAMAGKARAGCPVRNVQQTLDCLTRQGLSVAVYEEMEIPAKAKAKWRGIKHRYLAQVVSNACSTYMHDLCLSSSPVDFRENKPFVAIQRQAQGYTIIQIWVDSLMVRVTERMSDKGVESILKHYGHAIPVFVQPNVPRWMFLPEQTTTVYPSKSASHAFGSANTSPFYKEVLSRVGCIMDLNPCSFTSAAPASGEADTATIATTPPNPVYLSTAQQLGIVPFPGIPSLVEALLPTNSPAPCVRFMENWLLCPPSYSLADSMQTACRAIQDLKLPIDAFPTTLVPTGKLVSMVRRAQANAMTFREIYSMVKLMVTTMTNDRYDSLTTPMLHILEHMSGRTCSKEHLIVRGWSVLKQIKNAIAPSSSSTLVDPLTQTTHLAASRLHKYHDAGNPDKDPDRDRDTKDWDTNTNRNRYRDDGDRDNGDRDNGDRENRDREKGDRDNGDREKGERDNGERDNGDDRDDRDRDSRDDGDRVMGGERVGDGHKGDVFADGHAGRDEHENVGSHDSLTHGRQRSVNGADSSARQRPKGIIHHIPLKRPREGSLCPKADIADITDITDLTNLRSKQCSVPANKLVSKRPKPVALVKKPMRRLRDLATHLDSFFQRNEYKFRGHVLPTLPSILPYYRNLTACAKALMEAVEKDFPADALHHDVMNNQLVLKKKPKSTKTVYIHPRDRNKQMMQNRFTTSVVVSLCSGYVSAAEEAEKAVEGQLKSLAEAISQDMQVIVQAAHWGVLYHSINLHTHHARRLSWTIPDLEPLPKPVAHRRHEPQHRGDTSPEFSQDLPSIPPPLKLDLMIPYWMPINQAVPNSVTLDGIYLLTAPNMAGKSTLMRSILACSLLGNCGLFVPCTRAFIPRYDSYFLRATSHDVPAEGKSAFAVEMDDLRVMLRDCTPRSLMAADEIGKGTSSRDGATLCAGLLEYLSANNATCIFATHLHEILKLPIQATRLKARQMAVKLDNDNGRDIKTVWEYKLKPGVCLDSLALETARMCSIPQEIIQRALELEAYYDQINNRTFPTQGQTQAVGYQLFENDAEAQRWISDEEDSFRKAADNARQASQWATVHLMKKTATINALKRIIKKLRARITNLKACLRLKTKQLIVTDTTEKNRPCTPDKPGTTDKPGTPDTPEGPTGDFNGVELYGKQHKLGQDHDEDYDNHPDHNHAQPLDNSRHHNHDQAHDNNRHHNHDQDHNHKLNDNHHEHKHDYNANQGLYHSESNQDSHDDLRPIAIATATPKDLSMSGRASRALSPDADADADADREENDDSGMYREDRRIVSGEESHSAMVLRNAFPFADADDLIEITRFAHKLRYRTQDVKRLECSRERRRCDSDVVTKESRKWRNHCARFHNVLYNRNILTKPQWTQFMRHANIVYRPQYFDLFTSEQTCKGGFDGKACNNARDGVSPCKIDFLYASESERKKWVLDHKVEVREIARSLAIQRNRNRNIDIKRAAHALLSINPSPVYGPPNLDLRCKYCDSSKRHHLSYGSTRQTLDDFIFDTDCLDSHRPINTTGPQPPTISHAKRDSTQILPHDLADMVVTQIDTTGVKAPPSTPRPEAVSILEQSKQGGRIPLQAVQPAVQTNPNPNPNPNPTAKTHAFHPLSFSKIDNSTALLEAVKAHLDADTDSYSLTYGTQTDHPDDLDD